MKRNAKRINFEIIYRDPCFWTHLLRIQRTYVDDGGRAFLNQLVALESHLTTEYESESESETDTDDDDKNLLVTVINNKNSIIAHKLKENIELVQNLSDT